MKYTKHLIAWNAITYDDRRYFVAPRSSHKHSRLRHRQPLLFGPAHHVQGLAHPLFVAAAQHGRLQSLGPPRGRRC